MRNISTIFLTFGLIGTSVLLMTAPAFADAIYEQQKRESDARQQQELNALGALFGIFSTNSGPSVISTNGVVQYGVQNKLRSENIFIRAGAHFGGGGSTINGGLTFGLGGESAMFNPFIGGGLGYKSLKINNIKSDAFSFYGTGGIDLNLSRNLSITGAINIPTNSEYGTEYQVGITFFGF